MAEAQQREASAATRARRAQVVLPAHNSRRCLQAAEHRDLPVQAAELVGQATLSPRVYRLSRSPTEAGLEAQEPQVDLRWRARTRQLEEALEVESIAPALRYLPEESAETPGLVSERPGLRRRELRTEPLGPQEAYSGALASVAEAALDRLRPEPETALAELAEPVDLAVAVAAVVGPGRPRVALVDPGVSAMPQSVFPNHESRKNYRSHSQDIRWALDVARSKRCGWRLHET